jgi:hypothetical protein
MPHNASLVFPLEPQKDVLLFFIEKVDIFQRATGHNVVFLNFPVDDGSLEVKAVVNAFASLSGIRH